MTSTFNQLQKDLVRGKEGEDIVQEFLEKKFNIVAENYGGKNPFWDLDARDMFNALLKAKKDTSIYKKYGVTYEVKTDDTSIRTGNFYFEVWSNQKCLNPGCITACKADTIVIVSGKKLYFLNRALFYTWVFENLYMNTKLASTWREKTKAAGRGVFASAGKNSDVLGILIPLEHIKESYCCIGIFEY